MNYSEYLRRKLESMPRVFGPATIGDESSRTAIARYKATAAARGPTQQVDPTCCKHPGRDGEGARVYKRPGNGAQQTWSTEGRLAAAAGCAICGVGRVGYVYQDCCPQESTPEQPRDSTGALRDPTMKAAIYKGRETCCPVLGSGLSGPDCCTLEPGHINTLLANNVPNARIPIAPSEKSCCINKLPLASCVCC